MKKHWPRWVFASFSKHFAAHFAGQSPPVPLFVEGDDRNTAKIKDFAEFRLDGPRIRKLSKGYYRLFVPVNILITSGMDDQTVYRLQTTMGIALSGFAESISVFKLGAGPDDDQSLLVCMNLLNDKINELKESHFGQVDAIVRIQQASVEGHYEGFITTSE